MKQSQNHDDAEPATVCKADDEVGYRIPPPPGMTDYEYQARGRTKGLRFVDFDDLK